MSDNCAIYVVTCPECGLVGFGGSPATYFHNHNSALWYAGHHDGIEHPDADGQWAMPEAIFEVGE